MAPFLKKVKHPFGFMLVSLITFVFEVSKFIFFGINIYIYFDYAFVFLAFGTVVRSTLKVYRMFDTPICDSFFKQRRYRSKSMSMGSTCLITYYTIQKLIYRVLVKVQLYHQFADDTLRMWLPLSVMLCMLHTNDHFVILCLSQVEHLSKKQC